MATEMYVVYKQNGSIKYLNPNAYVQQGNDNVDKITIAIEGYDSSDNFNLKAVFKLPDGSTNQLLVSTPDTLTIDGTTYYARSFYLTSAQTVYPGVLKMTLQVTNSGQTETLFTYLYEFTINPTGTEPDETTITAAEAASFQQAISLKANKDYVDTYFVTLGTAQTITGIKTFSNGFKVNYIKNPTGTTSFFLGSNLGIGFYDNLIPDYPNKNSIGSAYYTIKDIYMAGALKIGSHYSIKEASNGGLYLYYDGTTEIFSFDDDTVNVAGVLYVDNDISASSDLFLANDFHVSSPSNIKFNTGNTNLQAKLDAKLSISDIASSVSSGSTNQTAPGAKLFYDTRTDIYTKIENLQSIGRFLSLWNSATGQPTTQPTSLPYAYKTGDYFIISNVPSGSATKYMPAGTSYTGTSADRTTTTDDLGVGDYFLFDGTQWRLLVNTTKSVTFGQIGGQPSDNNTLVNYLHDNFVPFSGGFENYFQITRDYDQTTGEIEITINTSVIGESYNASTGVLTLTFPS